MHAYVCMCVRVCVCVCVCVSECVSRMRHQGGWSTDHAPASGECAEAELVTGRSGDCRAGQAR